MQSKVNQKLEKAKETMKLELPLVMTVKDLIDILPMGESSIYSLMREGLITHKKTKGKILIPRDLFVEWLFDTED